MRLLIPSTLLGLSLLLFQPMQVFAGGNCSSLQKRKTKLENRQNKIPQRINKLQTRTNKKNNKETSKAQDKLDMFQTSYSDANDFCNDPYRHPTCWDIESPICMQTCPPGPPPTPRECGQMSGYEPNFDYCKNICSANRLVDIQNEQCGFLGPLQNNISEAQANLQRAQNEASARTQRTQSKVNKLNTKSTSLGNKINNINTLLQQNNC